MKNIFKTKYQNENEYITKVCLITVKTKRRLTFGTIVLPQSERTIVQNISLLLVFLGKAYKSITVSVGTPTQHFKAAVPGLKIENIFLLCISYIALVCLNTEKCDIIFSNYLSNLNCFL